MNGLRNGRWADRRDNEASSKASPLPEHCTEHSVQSEQLQLQLQFVPLSQLQLQLQLFSRIPGDRAPKTLSLTKPLRTDTTVLTRTSASAVSINSSSCPPPPRSRDVAGGHFHNAVARLDHQAAPAR